MSPLEKPTSPSIAEPLEKTDAMTLCAWAIWPPCTAKAIAAKTITATRLMR